MNTYQMTTKTVATIECANGCDATETVEVDIYWHQSAIAREADAALSALGWRDMGEEEDHALYCPLCVAECKILTLREQVRQLQKT